MKKVKLYLHHYRLLDHMEKRGGVSFWENYDLILQELVEGGYAIGKWAGTLDMDPWPHWNTTSEGRKALELWEKENKST